MVYRIDIGKLSRKEAEKSIRELRELMSLYKINLKRIIKIKKILEYELS
jgi:hypothetical protein